MSDDVRANVNARSSWLSFACWAAEYENRMRSVGVRVWPKDNA